MKRKYGTNRLLKREEKMIPGYMGKILWVDLTTGKIKIETPDDQLYRDYVGGYGIGVRMLYDRMKPGADALGPDNILGLTTGPITATAIPTGARYTAVGKSPNTGGWGDANSGGFFGPYLKFAGLTRYFHGAAKKPVYLLIDEGKGNWKDASATWGKDAYETEDILRPNTAKTPASPALGRAEKIIHDCRHHDGPWFCGWTFRPGCCHGLQEIKAGSQRHHDDQRADKEAVQKPDRTCQRMKATPGFAVYSLCTNTALPTLRQFR
jgi:hypothetical protein